MYAETDSNVNLNNVFNIGQTGLIHNFREPGIPTGMVLTPKGTVIPPSALVSSTAFLSFLNAKLINDTDSARFYLLTCGSAGIDDFKDVTKGLSMEDTGRLQLAIYEFPPKHEFRNMINMGNFIETRSFDNCQDTYSSFYIDSFGNV